MSKRSIDYSLYFVTGRELLPPNTDYYEYLEAALKGGVTVVQVREKTVDTGEFLEIAQRTKDVCDKYNVPVIINDRVDIALAVKAAGVHVGQSDMPLPVAKQLLGPDFIIGASVGNVEQAKKAVAEGADYVGIGAVYPTGSKSNAKVLGVRGVGPILDVLEGTDVKSVVIGGVKTNNLLRILHGAVSPSGKHVDGVAVISEIISSADPESSARRLSLLLSSFLRAGPSSFITPRSSRLSSTASPEELVGAASKLLESVRKHTPMVHQITNNVVINQSANITLALGASPIMATHPAEMEDLAKVPGGLLVNFGTVGDKAGMLEAGKWANYHRKPIVFDPVGVGATSFRRATCAELLGTWQPTVIKGNAAEIGSLWGSAEVAARGVDSVGAGFKDPSAVVKGLARRERCIVVLTGPVDYVSDGSTAIRLSNGHPLLGDITGSGCMLGTVLATVLGAASMDAGSPDAEDARLVRGDSLIAAIAAVLIFTVAAELAAAKAAVAGSGTFLPNFIDSVQTLKAQDVVARAKLEILEL